MSGLSLADMRRIGAERNQTGTQDKPSNGSLLSKLPFARGDGTSNPDVSPVSHLARLAGSKGRSGESPEPATTSELVSEPAAAGVLAGDAPTNFASTRPSAGDTFLRAEASKPLRQIVVRHVGIGGVVGAAAGIAATGVPLAAPFGGVLGAAAGNYVGKRSQRIAADTARALPLKAKQAPELFEAVRSACGLVECSEGSLKIAVDQSAGLRATATGGSRRSTPKGYLVTIGFAVLAGLALRQIEALAAHALVCARREAENETVDNETLARLASLKSSLGERSKLIRLTNLNGVQETEHQAQRAYGQALESHMREADRLAARYAGPQVLVEALLAQGLLAARFWQDGLAGQSSAESVAALRSGYAAAELDSALHFIADHRQPKHDEVRFGLPTMLLERIAGLDTSCAVPVLPAEAPVLETLTDSVQKAVTKRMLAPEGSRVSDSADQDPVIPKAAKTKTAKAAKKSKKKPAKPSAETASTSAVRSKGLFGLLSRGRGGKDVLPALDPHHHPLYHADELYKNDPALGLEAYQALVDANPRWALARLRMAEAQIEMGIPDCVANLMTCADRLPSALPTILDRLQSALAMVSPLEEEPLRQAVTKLQNDAAAVAQERAEIDLEKLSDCTLDAPDRETLSSLFSHSPGLREVWVLGAPCVYMPEVPHHAILGLAPRMSAEDAHALAMALAEHAAVSGTVAVHIETGTPRGALGDTLATYPSLWRASRG
ncbi:MAG: hypothetical protein JJ908_04770 [Rhizobiales bacterium]|nr:hypothetical protein [Hyphomicrobiales bacterium]MBO6698085.1 hypothetical protein [Hyphomicrobiales bacterium]MBO6735661.1 hypothetical protein [Hyphomicrobiales bacterium]MBO6910531.1 hypothetical protein [Hyphomicrobiales bacterium]MBO6956118.1 hypothetical protein [Hyphomicrobiales bacterium]